MHLTFLDSALTKFRNIWIVHYRNSSCTHDPNSEGWTGSKSGTCKRALLEAKRLPNSLEIFLLEMDIDKMRRISFDNAAEFYDETRGPPIHAMKQLVKTLAEELQEYRSILDVGVGTGRFSKPLQGSGLKVVGIDIAKKMLEKAVEKQVENLLRADACFLPFRDKTFEASVCIHLLHLISKWRDALGEICRVTQDVMLSTCYTTKNPVRQAYNQILEGYGYKSRRPGKGEWELKDFIKPKSVFVATFENRANELLEYLSHRAYSSQWNIPKHVNKKAVKQLRQEFSGKVFPAELQVLVWQIDDLKDYCTSFKHTLS